MMANRISKRLWMGAALAMALAGGIAHADCAEPHPPRVCAEFFHSDSVMLARIMSERQVPNTPDPRNVEGWFYKVQVIKTFRGGKLPNDEVWTDNDQTKFPLEVGKTYLLFIRPNQDLRPTPDVCGNSAEMSKAKESISEIDKLIEAAQNNAGADIWGHVMLALPNSQAMSKAGEPGMMMAARSDAAKDEAAKDDTAKDDTAKTDAAKSGNDGYIGLSDVTGLFHMHVPAGRYTVTGASDDFDVMPYALAYMMPKNIELTNDGSCADLMFLAEPK